MKFLVTDDSKLARLSLIKVLKANVQTSEIFQATNGQEAVELVIAKQPDIAFLDLTMPIMNGYEALPKMLEAHPKLKVVVVSADIQEQAKKRVIELGAKLHVQKPINADKLQDILEIL